MAKLFYKDKPIIGLDISQTGMKVMSVDVKKWLVTGYGSIDLDPVKVQQSLDGDGNYLINSLRSLLHGNLVGTLASHHVVLGIPAARTFTRTFTLPPSSEKNLKDAVELEVDQYIPVPLAALYVDYEVIERTKDQLTVLMCAVPQTVVATYTALVHEAGLRVCMVETSASAVARLLEATEEGHLPTVIVDIGPATTDIAILDGSIRITGSLSIGGNTFTLDIAKKLHVPLENAHQLKVLNGLNAGSRQLKITNALKPSLDRIISETRRVIRYYDERIDNHRKLEQVLVVGGGANVPGIGDYFTNELVMPARVASPWQQLNFGKLPQPAKQFRPRYITVAGLASVDPKRIWK
ncbi:Cell division protein FtsA [Candidatus Saccharibacteria bacterium RAAC3_TM7_1]|nr:Cell division protein FtsA [Candidatus Saccharibacteria bacterium RAAC3_TM7_1]HCZ28793.1 type IV pilus assembly protein PilM [Candidatus Saccharibacteria bacterium]